MPKVYVLYLLMLILLLPNIVLSKTDIPLVLDIYNDGSISLSGTLSRPYYGEEEGSALLLADIYEDKFYIKTIFQVNTTERLPHIMLNIHTRRSSIDSRAKWSVNGSISLRDENGNLTIVIERLNVISDNNLMNMTGKANITVTGYYAILLFYSPLLNKEFVEMILEQNNITGVDVRTLSISREDSSLEVIFELTLNIQKLLKGTNKTMIKELSKSLNAPIVMDFNTKLVNNCIYVNANIEVHSNINDVLITFANLIKSLEKWIEEQHFYVVPLEEHYTLTLWALRESAETFSILSSSAYFKITVVGNTTSITFKTPKMVKKGARNASETIRALYDLILNATKRIEKAKCIEISISDVLNTTVKLRPDENVEISLRGSRVSSVKLSDLPYLEIRVKKYISSMSKTIMGVAISALITTMAILMLRRKYITSFI